MRSALDSLTVAALLWLATHIQADWFNRYSVASKNYRLPLDKERGALASKALLEAIYAPTMLLLITLNSRSHRSLLAISLYPSIPTH